MSVADTHPGGMLATLKADGLLSHEEFRIISALLHQQRQKHRLEVATEAVAARPPKRCVLCRQARVQEPACMVLALILRIGSSYITHVSVSRPAKRRKRGKAPGIAGELSTPLWDQLAQKFPLPLLTEKQVTAQMSCVL